MQCTRQGPCAAADSEEADSAEDLEVVERVADSVVVDSAAGWGAGGSAAAKAAEVKVEDLGQVGLGAVDSAADLVAVESLVAPPPSPPAPPSYHS